MSMHITRFQTPSEGAFSLTLPADARVIDIRLTQGPRLEMFAVVPNNGTLEHSTRQFYMLHSASIGIPDWVATAAIVGQRDGYTLFERVEKPVSP